jgi:hypothetical protein
MNSAAYIEILSIISSIRKSFDDWETYYKNKEHIDPNRNVYAIGLISRSSRDMNKIEEIIKFNMGNNNENRT